MTALPVVVPPHFSPLMEVGGLVFVSGQLAFDELGHIAGDVREQTRRCLCNIESLLQGAGLSRGHIVKATVWLRNAHDFRPFNDRYAEYFGDHRPARSTVVCELARPEALVEIEAIAARPHA